LANQLRFEGAELEALLEQVRDEMGTGARIVAANRIRKGGVGGFFARERFEVLVEEDELRPNLASRAPASLLDLADEVSASERGTSLVDLGADAPEVSTESSDFNDMLARLTEQFEERKLFEARKGTLAEATVATALDPIVVDEPEVIERPVAVGPALATPATPVPAPAVVTATPPAAAPMPAPVLAPAAPVPTAAPAPMPTSAPGPKTLAASVARMLADLGLPPDLVPRNATVDGLRPALLDALSRLPETPRLPDTNGVVIAVVGEGTAPARLARRLAGDLGIDLESVELASPRQGCDLAEPEAAAERRLAWRRRPRPTIVVVSAGRSARDLAWARSVLDRLEPTFVWSVVDASCKSADVGDRLARIGGADALAIDGIEETVSPASALELGVPVGRLDGRVASPLLWTDILVDRIPRRARTS
jgi:hypothetical protein